VAVVATSTGAVVVNSTAGAVVTTSSSPGLSSRVVNKATSNCCVVASTCGAAVAVGGADVAVGSEKMVVRDWVVVSAPRVVSATSWARPKPNKPTTNKLAARLFILHSALFSGRSLRSRNN